MARKVLVTMDTLTFVSEALKSLAWPVVVVFLVLMLKKPITELIPLLRKLKYKELEMEFSEAVIQSAAVRAKPIALTGLAAMLGALFILDDPIFNGLAISLIFGIFVSTVLTLVVIPVLYYAAFKKEYSS